MNGRQMNGLQLIRVHTKEACFAMLTATKLIACVHVQQLFNDSRMAGHKYDGSSDVQKELVQWVKLAYQAS